jgi:nucleotide-binding universal stress UspA family protein
MNKMKKILFAIGEGPTSEKVASDGFEISKQLNAEIALVSIVDTSTLSTDGGITLHDMVNIIRSEFKKNHNLLIENIFKEYKVWTFIEEGKPFEMILKIAEEWGADLIVIGTHGRKGFSHLLMGSVAEKVIRHSNKPLFVIPTR